VYELEGIERVKGTISLNPVARSITINSNGGAQAQLLVSATEQTNTTNCIAVKACSTEAGSIVMRNGITSSPTTGIDGCDLCRGCSCDRTPEVGEKTLEEIS
jgi:hypothetical protein